MPSRVRHGGDFPSGGEAQFLVKQTEDIPGVLKKAFWLAASGRPGPVVVDLPKDILNPAKKLPYVWPDAVSMRSYNPTTSGHKGQIKRALQTTVAASKPVVYVGGGAINAHCEPQLRELVEKLKLPVASSLMGLGAFPATHSQALGMLGMHGTYEANMTMHHSDVILPSAFALTTGPPITWPSIVRTRRYCILISIRLQSRKPCRQMCRSSAMPGWCWSRCWSCWSRRKRSSRWTTFATGGNRSSSGVPVIVCATTTRAIKSNRRR